MNAQPLPQSCIWLLDCNKYATIQHLLLWIWPKIPNIGAGLAVAISLVPPVANISRGVVLLDNSIVTESLLTFLMNTAGVIIGALFIFFYKYKLRH